MWEARLIDGKVLALILSLLTPDERAHGVVYALAEPVADGTTFPAGPVPVVAATRVYVAFVDREPLANWGHPARYLLVDAKTAAVTSIEARFPPFGANKGAGWRVVYRAAGVPDVVLAAPE
jgi:hypothetical protein